MENPFVNRLMKDNKEDIIHSSAYARAQRSGMGVDSVESFAERRRIDRNRTVVRRYSDSRIASGSGVRDINERLRAEKSAEKDKSLGISNEFTEIGKKNLIGAREKLKKVDKKMGQFGVNEARNKTIDNRYNFAKPSSGRVPTKYPVRRNPGISR